MGGPGPQTSVLAGWMAVAAGAVAALAPLLPWLRLEIHDPSGTRGLAVTTSGWGSLSVDAPGAPDGMRWGGWDAWSDWTVAAVPDGAVASLVAVAVIVGGMGTVRAARRPEGAAPAVWGLGVVVASLVGLGWVLLSWFQGRRGLRATEEMFGAFTGSPAAASEALSMHVGSGLVAGGVVFAFALVVGFRILASAPAGPSRPPQEGEPGSAGADVWRRSQEVDPPPPR